MIHVNPVAWAGSSVSLEGCSISNNTLGLHSPTPLPTVFADNGGNTLKASVYSDDVTLPVCIYEGEERRDIFEPVCSPMSGACTLAQPCNETQAQPLTQSPEDDTLLSGEDTWLVDVQQVHIVSGFP